MRAPSSWIPVSGLWGEKGPLGAFGAGGSLKMVLFNPLLPRVLGLIERVLLVNEGTAGSFVRAGVEGREAAVRGEMG